MDDSSAKTPIDRITDELRADPYRPDLLIERLILQVVHDDRAGAHADLAVLRRLGIARTLTPTLALLTSGSMRAVTAGGAYVLFDAAVDERALELTLECLRTCRRSADDFFGLLNCRLIVELSPGFAGLHHASREVPGVGYLKLSPRYSAWEYTQLLSHELAHLCLSAGNRFLDEGIAVLFQSRACGGRIYLGTELDLRTPVATAPNQPLPLRALLAYDGRYDVYFDRLAPGLADKRLIYLSAFVVTEHLFDRLRLDGLRALCACLRTASSCAAHPTIVAEFLGESIESLDQRLFARPRNPAGSTHRLIAASRSLPSSTVVWSELTPEELDELVAHLHRTTPSKLPRVLLHATLARALTRRLLDSRSLVPAADLAELRSLMHELRGDGSLPERERTLLEGWTAIAEIHSAGAVAARIVSWEKALGLFSAALARFPDDPEVLCATAALHLRGPAEYGANRELARRCLARAAGIEGWAAFAGVIARELGGE